MVFYLPIAGGKESTGNQINKNPNQQNTPQSAMIAPAHLSEIPQLNLERNDSGGYSLPIYSSLQAGGGSMEMMGLSLSRPSSLILTSPQSSFSLVDSSTIPVGDD